MSLRAGRHVPLIDKRARALPQVLRIRHKRSATPLGGQAAPVLPLLPLAPSHHRRGRMRRSVLVALLALAGACRERPEVAGPQPAAPRLQANVLDPALAAALATATPTASLEVIVNYDETLTTRDAVSNAMLDLGAGVVQFRNLALVAGDRKSTRLNSSHLVISYAVFCLKKKKKK